MFFLLVAVVPDYMFSTISMGDGFSYKLYGWH
jgi:hypothetical protein